MVSVENPNEFYSDLIPKCRMYKTTVLGVAHTRYPLSMQFESI